MQPRANALQDSAPPPSPSSRSYVNPIPEDLSCVVCHAAAVDAVVAKECGHLFCKECATQKGKCPIDHNPLGPDTVHKDARAQRMIRELVVWCSRRDDGCTWQGPQHDYDRHVPRCEHAAAPCPFAVIGCRVAVPRKGIAEHLAVGTVSHMSQLSEGIVKALSDIKVLQQHLDLVRSRCRQDTNKQHIWVIAGFDTKRGPIYSPKFFLRGHGWYLGVDADGPEQHAGVYLFAEGHTRRVDYHLTLLHRDEALDKVHTVADWRKDYKGKGWGPLKFINRPTLATSGFLVDGCVRIGLHMENDAYD